MHYQKERLLFKNTAISKRLDRSTSFADANLTFIIIILLYYISVRFNNFFGRNRLERTYLLKWNNFDKYRQKCVNILKYCVTHQIKVNVKIKYFKTKSVILCLEVFSTTSYQIPSFAALYTWTSNSEHRIVVVHIGLRVAYYPGRGLDSVLPRSSALIKFVSSSLYW